MEILEKMLDQHECYQIMVEIFYGYVPDDKKLSAMADAATRIYNEVKNSTYTRN